MKKIIITGGGTGLGRELAKEYSLRGYYIIILGRRIKPLEDVKKEILNNGGKCHIASCDISNYENVTEIIDNIIHTHKEIDILINNAGIGFFGSIEELKVNDINRMIDVNLKGTIYVTKAIIPHFKKLGRGKVINIISTAGLRGKVNEGVYCATKFGVRGLSESLKKELGLSNIDVIPVYMGGMNTPFWDDSTHIKDKSRLKSPREVAKSIINSDDGREEIIIDK